MSDNAAASRAETLLAIGRNDEAVAVLSAALAADPDDVGMIRLLASAHLAADRLQLAADTAFRAIRLEPDNEWGHRLLSEALSRLGNHDAARHSAAQSLRLSPHQWRTHTQLALVTARGGRAAEAMTAAKHAVELAPNEPDTHFVLGYAAKLAGDPGLAEQAYRNTLALRPDHAMAMNNLSTLQLERVGGLRRAAHGFGSALRSDPQLDIARRNLSVVARRYMRRFHISIVIAYFVVSIASARPTDVSGTDHVGLKDRLVVGLVGGAAFVVLVGAAVVVDRGLPPNLRPYFRRLPVTDRWLGAWLLLDLTALVMISLIAVPSTYNGRSALSSAAWALLLIGLLLSYGRRLMRRGRRVR